ncbi:MAG: carboxypeptidase M32 [Lachnospiraceae bacterium]|nr:carboxypeptidase M32 [Lachnospiraceae bacterium]
MEKELKKNLDVVTETLSAARNYWHACSILNYDQQTISPKKAKELQGETEAFLGNQAFQLLKSKKFIKAMEYIYENRAELGKYDSALAKSLYREYQRIKRITPKMHHEFSLVYNKAYVDWLEAKEASDFSRFEKSLKKVRDVSMKKISLRKEHKNTDYDHLLDDYETGMTESVLDETFGACKERLIPFLEKIKKSNKKIRTDFMRRKAPQAAQEKLAQYLLDLIRYDFSRGAISTTEHPFMDDLAVDDVRVTTHYYEENFASSMFSVLHEGGHALFGQNTPRVHYKHFIEDGKTLGMHESVSRFYENRIGRSRAFIDLLYPKTKELFPEVFSDVSAEEFYEAVNVVNPSLIRIEADEFTYTFHIIIRYELEKMIINEGVKISDLPKLWADKYEEYLGVRPDCDKTGVLQDVHWSGGFGYFPTYALGNMYNAMYFNKFKEKYDIDKLVSGSNFDIISDWMTKHVYKKADRLDPKDWILDITGREFTPKDFLDYLEEKFGALYGIS